MKKVSFFLRRLLFISALSLFSMFTFAQEAPIEDVLPQMSSDGNLECTLKRVSLRKDVLTIQGVIENISDEEQEVGVKYEDVSFIDLEDDKRYMVLTDEENLPVAGPLDFQSSARIFRDLQPGEKVVFWVKFPAPSESTEVIDFVLPGFMPFEEVPIAK